MELLKFVFLLNGTRLEVLLNLFLIIQVASLFVIISGMKTILKGINALFDSQIKFIDLLKNNCPPQKSDTN